MARSFLQWGRGQTQNLSRIWEWDGDLKVLNVLRWSGRGAPSLFLQFTFSAHYVLKVVWEQYRENYSLIYQILLNNYWLPLCKFSVNLFLNILVPLTCHEPDITIKLSILEFMLVPQILLSSIIFLLEECLNDIWNHTISRSLHYLHKWLTSSPWLSWSVQLDQRLWANNLTEFLKKIKSPNIYLPLPRNYRETKLLMIWLDKYYNIRAWKKNLNLKY